MRQQKQTEALEKLEREKAEVERLKQEEDELTPEERERRYRQEYFEEQRLKREERWKSGQTTNTLGHPSSAIRVEQGKVLGEGSFGQVLEGTLTTEEGEVAVVLKRAKEGVFGAEELLTSELKLSGKALEVSGGRTAAFMGAVEVGYAEEGQIYDGVLSTGINWEELPNMHPLLATWLICHTMYAIWVHYVPDHMPYVVAHRHARREQWLGQLTTQC